MSTEQPSHGETTAESSPASDAASTAEAPASRQRPAKQENPRYESQAAAAEPAPIAFEGGARALGEADGGVTRRREWVFLALAVVGSVVLVSIPAVLFTGIDLTGAGEDEAAAPVGSVEARELERLQLLQETRSEAFAKLSAYGTTEDGAYRIPVEQAMRLTARETYAPAAGQDAEVFSSELMLHIPGGARPSGRARSDTAAAR